MIYSSNLLAFIFVASQCAYGTTDVFSVYPTENVRLQYQYKTAKYSSHLECLLWCQQEPSCNSASYEGGTGTCELNDKGIYNWTYFHLDTANGWEVYIKGPYPCASGWLLHELSCYFFSTVDMTWLQASEMCKKEGSNLVQIESENEQIFLTKKLQAIHGGSTNFNYYTNGNDMDTEFRWVWGYPQGQEMAYKNWNVGEPNGNLAEACMALYGPANYNWVDCPCDWKFFYICEKTIVN